MERPLRITLLAAFPLHYLDELKGQSMPDGHYATWLPQLAKAYEGASRFEFHWIIVSKLINTPQTVTQWGQKFHLIPATQGGWRAPTLYHEERRRIRLCLQEIQPDLVHGWGTEDLYAFAAATSGYPNVVSMQGILTHYILRNRMHPRDYIQAMLECYVLHRADRITVESAWGRDRLLRINPSAQIELVEYGVDDLFLDIPWRPDPTRPVALFVGSVCARKGVPDLIAAFADPALAGVELRIVGSGGREEEEALRQIAPPNVRWLGRLSRKETAQQLSQAWVLMLPTRADTSPNVVKEARVVGLPVITTPCGGQVAYVQEGVTGFITHPGDIAALVAATSRLLGDFSLCQRMGAAHHAEHRAVLHPSETARRFLQLYDKMLEMR